MNGGAGLRDCLRVATLVTSGLSVRRTAAWTSAGVAVADVDRLAVDPDDLGRERVAVGRREERLERPVLAGGERLDLALALDDEPNGDRLDAAGRQAGPDLAREQRAQRVADEAVDDPAGLLGVDEVGVDVARGSRTRRGSRPR